MANNEAIILQINVRRKPGAPLGLEATIDKCPHDHLQLLAMLGLVQMTCERTIKQFASNKEFMKPSEYDDADKLK